MKDRYVRVAAVTPEIAVADPEANRREIEEKMRECAADRVKVAVFPELCLSGYTCSDLFLQRTLLEGVRKALWELAAVSAELDCLYLIGLPWEQGG